MAESIFVYSPISSLVVRSARKTKVTYHWVGMVVGLVFALAGTFFIWYNKELSNKPHMTSWHGILGYITVGYYVIECSAGIVVKYPSLVKAFVRPADLKLYHATAALLLFMLACITLVLAMFSDWFVATVTGTSWYMCVICPGILALAVMNQITTSFNHVINPGARNIAQTANKSR